MFRRMTICLLLLAGFTSFAWAEAPKTHKPSQKWAVLIGINDYTYLSKLKFCAADMQALRGQLLDAGFVDAQIRLLSDKEADRKYLPSKTNIETQVDLVCRLAEEGDVILLAYSGHGVERRGQGYLCPQDAKIDRVDESLIPIDWIYTRLGKSKAALRLMVVDACREELDPNSTRGADDVIEANKRFVKQLNSVPKGTVLLNSCGPDEFAREDKSLSHGVFSHFLLKGLAGEADENGDGVVTVGELAKFTARETRNYVALKFASAQFPYIKQDADIGALDYDLGRVRKKVADNTQPAEGSRAGDVREDNDLKQKLVWCPKGTFTMGSPKSEAGHSDEEDQKSVTLSKGFWLGQTSVTQSQFKIVMGSEPWKGMNNVKEGPRYPATYVDWNEATDFCKKLTESESRAGRLPRGWKYDLPTEAQREYATRAGTTTAYAFGNDASKLSEYAWWGGIVGDGNAKTDQYAHEVGTKKPNAWGLYDLHGNVYERCRDYYADKLPGGTDPLMGTGSQRVYRGGCWYYGAGDCRSAIRRYGIPSSRHNDLGFRIALVSSS